MERLHTTVTSDAARASIRNAVCRSALIVACALLADHASAQQETLGALLDKGAKKMSSADVRSAVTAKRLGGLRWGSLQDVSYDADGSMAGYTPDGGFWIVGEWTVDDKGKQCFDWAGWGSIVCYSWFKLGDDMYYVDAASDGNRNGKASRLTRQ